MSFHREEKILVDIIIKKIQIYQKLLKLYEQFDEDDSLKMKKMIIETKRDSLILDLKRAVKHWTFLTPAIVKIILGPNYPL